MEILSHPLTIAVFVVFAGLMGWLITMVIQQSNTQAATKEILRVLIKDREEDREELKDHRKLIEALYENCGINHQKQVPKG